MYRAAGGVFRRGPDRMGLKAFSGIVGAIYSWPNSFSPQVFPYQDIQGTDGVYRGMVAVLGVCMGKNKKAYFELKTAILKIFLPFSANCITFVV